MGGNEKPFLKCHHRARLWKYYLENWIKREMHDRYFYTTEVMYYIDIWQEKLVQHRKKSLLQNVLNKYIGIDVNVNLYLRLVQYRPFAYLEIRLWVNLKYIHTYIYIFTVYRCILYKCIIPDSWRKQSSRSRKTAVSKIEWLK